MILKAKERGGGRQLGLYLLRCDTNEHVEVHELRGFMSDHLPSALQEIDAIGRGTKAKNLFFSLSINPPPNEKVTAEQYEAAANAVEQKLGLGGQPRAIVFHEVEGRRHAHAVWSRIDAANMKAINLPFYKTKLRDVSKELFLEHGFRLPRGFVDSRERDPANFSLAEWQQSKRTGHDPKQLKAMFRELWASSDSGKAFTAALASRGYSLARGDRRSHVAVDYRGEVYAVARLTGIKTKEVRSWLGSADELPAIEQAKSAHAARMTDMLRRHIQNAEERRKREAANLLQRRQEIVQRQLEERVRLEKQQAERQMRETQDRQARLRKGWRGLWDRVTGKRSKLEKQNEAEALQTASRDRAEKQRLVQRHIDERKPLHQQIKWQRQTHAKQIEELHRDIASFAQTAKEPPKMKEQFREAQQDRERPRRGRTRNRGPDRER